MKTLNIVGAGRLGRTLGRLWHDSGTFEILGIVNRTEESAADAVDFIGAGSALPGIEALRAADVTMLSVVDAQIEPIAARLAASAPSEPGCTVFHCSGALASDKLDALTRRGAHCASVHPVMSFTDPLRALRVFPGTWCGAEGDPVARALIDPAFVAIGGRLFEIDPQEKMIYHAGSVFACNYLVALLEAALTAFERSGVPRETGLAIMAPLVRGTVDNVLTLGPAAALSGPIARGDRRLVGEQHRALSVWNEDMARLYRDLGQIATRLARERAEIPPADLDALARLLGGS